MLFVALSLGGCASASINSAGYGNTGSSGQSGASQGAGSLQVVANLPPPVGVGSDVSQVVRVGDSIKVDVFGVDELDRDVQVDPNGQISLALVGTIDAAGKTISALEAEVVQRYGSRYLQNPQVTLGLQQSVTLDGEFNKAGSYPVSGNTTLLRVIAAAGNFNSIGDPANVFVYRTIDGRDYVAQYDVAAIRAGRRPDTQVYGGDIVVAFPSGMKVLGSNLGQALGLARNASGLL
ncbi:polysaccharide biosynthesis/export family protein [Devosia sp.]|uniref:polysaccharide biosynthesis/export family protein n=1 Tax=Devosia sp. TaxID=1871048 RepID=UPI00260CB431|nr:polysaccharide biosynthesis/export family protein [Devosia sp.]